MMLNSSLSRNQNHFAAQETHEQIRDEDHLDMDNIVTDDGLDEQTVLTAADLSAITTTGEELLNELHKQDQDFRKDLKLLMDFSDTVATLSTAATSTSSWNTTASSSSSSSHDQTEFAYPAAKQEGDWKVPVNGIAKNYRQSEQDQEQADLDADLNRIRPNTSRQLPKLSIDCSMLKNATPLEQLSAISSALRSPYGSALLTKEMFPLVAESVAPVASRDMDLNDDLSEEEEDDDDDATAGKRRSLKKKQRKRTFAKKAEYRCLDCDKVFTQQAHLSIHRRKHTGERPYICPFEGCGKSFTQYGNLKTHERRHTGERPYKCSFPGCNKAFSQMGNMKTHEQLHTGVKPFVCEVPGCTKSFTQLGNLKSHQIKLHPDAKVGLLEVVMPKIAEAKLAGPSKKPRRKSSSRAPATSSLKRQAPTSTYDSSPSSKSSMEDMPQHMLPPRKRNRTASSSVISSVSDATASPIPSYQD